MRLVSLVLGLGGLAFLACPRVAHAFEREWHVGAGAGVTNGSGLSLSPAVTAYVAYGLSDVFDARVEVTGRGYEIGSDRDPHSISAAGGLVYKLDVLRWVPWAGVYLGYVGFLTEPRAELPFARHDAAIGLGLGLDYAFSRKLGLGVTLRYDDALTHADSSNFDALLRAEYRWGW
jgi:hypothetical protein